MPGIGRGTAFSSSAFALESGKVSPPVKTPRGLAILRVKEIKAPRLPELADVEAKVRAALTARADDRPRLRRARARARRARRPARRSTRSPQSFGLEAARQRRVRRHRHGARPRRGARDGAARAVARPGPDRRPGAHPRRRRAVRGHRRKAFDAAAFATEKAATRATLERNEVNRLLGSLLDQKKREQKVNYDRPLLEQFGLLGQGTAKASLGPSAASRGAAKLAPCASRPLAIHAGGAPDPETGAVAPPIHLCDHLRPRPGLRAALRPPLHPRGQPDRGAARGDARRARRRRAGARLRLGHGGRLDAARGARAGRPRALPPRPLPRRAAGGRASSCRAGG